jgi:autotransporter-associated beta strand protein
MLLATSALASAALPITVAHADDATWRAAPVDGNFNTAENWDGNVVPQGAAIFQASNVQNVDVGLFDTINVGGFTVIRNAGDYTFTSRNSTLSFTDFGISVGANASATLNINDGGTTTFLQNSTAGNATINNNGSNLKFVDASAASATITNNGGTTTFSGSSTAGQALIDINDGSVTFTDHSKAGSSTLNVLGDQANGIRPVLSFNLDSRAEQATISVSSSGSLNFSDRSSAGSAKITNNGFTAFFTNSKAGQANITNNVSGNLDFDGDASAEAATITNFSNAFTFFGKSTAANATIFNHGELQFNDSSSAGNASIESDGRILFQDQSSGGTARIKLDNGTLDISSLSMAGTMVGSIEGSGSVFLGSQNLAVGGNDGSTAFSGVIQDGASAGGGNTGGSLTKEGKGALTLTGINTYTGATNVNNGALVVDGSIASSSGVTVNAGGTLMGTGTVASTVIADGGTLAPGHGAGSLGTLTVQGNLSFTAAATYRVQVSPAAASSTSVTGTAALGGATVAANFAPGTYLTKQYGILNATGGLNGSTFGSLANTNLSPMFKASLSYDANNAFLNVTAPAVVGNDPGGGGNGPGGGGDDPRGGGNGPNADPNLNTNQRNVANAIVNSFNLMSGIPIAFATLAPAGLTQISGETAVGTQQATFDAMNQFMAVMLDPTVSGRSGGLSANDAYASMARKAPLAAESFNARWNVWAAGFGGSQSISGDAVLGSNKTTSSVFGSPAGAEYRFSPNTVAGFALAGGGTHFNVVNGGSGNSDLFQAGAYLRHTQGAAFLAAALAYGWQDVTTNRMVTVAGIDSLRARFNANAVSGRLEGGYRVATAAGDLTPYAAGQFISYRLPSYAEQAVSGANTFALGYNGKDVTATRTELGLRSEQAVALTDATLMLRGRVAWAHDYNTDRNVQSAFVTLPGSAFVVNGAQPAADTALTTVSAEMLWRNGWSASATADAQWSDTTHSYSGKGVVRYSW